jgi:hypothetical protein
MKTKCQTYRNGWCRDEASGIARAWREGREFGHDVAAVWAEAV